MIRLLCLLLALLVPATLSAETLRLAVTTSFENSGLADVLRPAIKRDLDLDLQLLVVGTGQALKLGEAGDVDAVLVHSRSAEEAFVAAGHATHRREIMYNDFVLIGPAGDPADISSAPSATVALARIATTGALFVSRGDDSGTHKMEQSLWARADITPDTLDGYRAVGAGMGAALNTASALDAYILSDRPTWLTFGNKRGLALLFAGDPVLFNPYSLLPVNPACHSHVRADAVARLEAWLVGPRGRAVIEGYMHDGQPLFVHSAVLD
ncbi:MAG: substrate-binding domain-containing protein [Sulfitobacter sp.]